jgi:hypothetical protein
MLMDVDSTVETRAIAIVGMSLTFGLVSLLQKKGVLTKAEMDNLFQGVLESLENSPATSDQGVQAARVLVEGMAQVAATGAIPPFAKDRT